MSETEKQAAPDNREWELGLSRIRKAHGYSDAGGQKKMYEQAHQAEALAKEILKLSRSTLLLHLRFMETALVRFVPGRELLTKEIATDGHFLYYNSAHICRQFKKARELPVRDYLHVVFHCLFRHLFVGRGINQPLWDLSCDIAVENLISELDLRPLYCERQENQKWLIEKLKKELPRLTAERIYHYLENEESVPPSEYKRIRESFYADDHSIWYRKPELTAGKAEGNERENDLPEQTEMFSGSSQSGQNESDVEQTEEGEELQGKGGSEEVRKSGGEKGSGSADNENDREDEEPGMAPTPRELQEQWTRIAERVQVDLETFSQSYGDGEGGLIQTLKEINREKCNYAAFLRRFAVLGENTELNDEEFDYIFYNYGIKLYKNIPLLEPLEYREVKKVKEFVIALDTSESVSGDLVQKFVTKTWNLLKQSENFFTRVNVHIIQCGAKVEEDAKITSDEEFDAYIQRMVLKGFGGTDFRPVFRHVDEMIRRHEFQNLKGMIYFTDGYGTYPPMPPAYETAFIFLEQSADPPKTPPWAIRILFTEEEIRGL